MWNWNEFNVFLWLSIKWERETEKLWCWKTSQSWRVRTVFLGKWRQVKIISIQRNLIRLCDKWPFPCTQGNTETHWEVAAPINYTEKPFLDQGCPRRTSALWARVMTPTPWVDEDKRVLMGCLGKELKKLKGQYLSGLRRNKHLKTMG